MKYNLLKLVQKVLNSIDGDEVNSWSDTVESVQVAHILENCYEDIASGMDLPEDFGIMELEATDASTPILMTKPSTVDELVWLKYNKVKDGDTDPVWSPVQYLSPSDFHQMTSGLLPSDTNVDTFSKIIDGSLIEFYYNNDASPDYYTYYGGDYLVFNSIDLSVDANLQKAKTQAYCRKFRVWTMDDTFVPNLPEQQFSLLLNEAIATAWQDMKQASNARAEKKARRGMTRLQKSKWDVNTGQDAYSQMKGYGRK